MSKKAFIILILITLYSLRILYNRYKPSMERFWGMGECLYEWVADRGTESNGKGLICNVVIINGL